MKIPETRYAKAPDGTSIAYQVIGDGAVDLVYASGIWSNVEMMWEFPPWARYLERLAAFSRLILFDMRGVGLSDRGPSPPMIELQRDDIRAVMDHAGIDHAFLFGGARAASMAMLFAATHPERTDALVLYAPVVKMISSPDYPHGMSPEMFESILARLDDLGTGRLLDVSAPSLAGDERAARWWGRFERLVVSPSAFEELWRILGSIDLRGVLPAIGVPTLVLHRAGDVLVSSGAAGDVAARIADARYIELSGVDHLPFAGDADEIIDEVEEFVTGSRHPAEPDRILATVLFTDIVGSTELAARLGDARWKELLAAHDEDAKAEIERYRGTYVDSMGDGLLARFDGPARAVRCALAMLEDLRSLGIEIRAGCHTGEIELADEKVRGLAVHIGARVASLAGPSQVWTSSTVRDLAAGSGLVFEDTGEHELKGVPDRWHLYRVVGERT